MENSFGLLVPVGGGGGGRRGVSSGGSSSGSMSTVSKEDNLVLSSEVSSSSSYADESELELGLGLSLSGSVSKSKLSPCPWGQYARILTAKDFPSLVSNSSSLTKANVSTAGTKRAADSVSPPRNGVSPVVGWPPVRAYRINSLANQAKSSPSCVSPSTVEKIVSKEIVVDKADEDFENKNNVMNGKQILKTCQFVKVNMDGVPIGRKVDLSAHSCYETLAQKLENMFCRPNITFSAGGSSLNEQDVMTEAAGCSKLSDGSSAFVLTYEDKEGDWMLVGDVPWRMFVNSVKRLRIMRKREDNGLALRFEERKGRQRTRHI